MLKKICISALLILSLSLFISCKSSKSSNNPDDGGGDDSGIIESVSDAAEDTSSVSFLNQDCETTWTNIVSLFPVNKTFSVDSSRLISNSSTVTEEFRVTASSSSSIKVEKTNRISGYRFSSHWGVLPPQDLEKSSFITQCNEIKSIINNGSYKASTTNGTVSLGGTSYDTISLTIAPSLEERHNSITRDSVFNKLNKNLSANWFEYVWNKLKGSFSQEEINNDEKENGKSYTIVFTQSHMLIYKRVYTYTQINNNQTSITSTISSF